MNLVSKQRVGSLRETLKSNFAAPQLRAESSELSESKSPETFNDRCKENKKNRDQKILWSDLNCKNPPQHCQKSHIIRDKVMISSRKQLRRSQKNFFLFISAKSSRWKWVLEVDLDVFSPTCGAAKLASRIRNRARSAFGDRDHTLS